MSHCLTWLHFNLLSGGIIVVGGSASLTLALTWGGVEYAWSAPQTLAPLIIGVVARVIAPAHMHADVAIRVVVVVVVALAQSCERKVLASRNSCFNLC